MPGPRVRRLPFHWHVIVPLVASVVVYGPVTGSYFLGDDFLHLIEVANQPLGAVLWRPYMGHLYVLPTANYWLLWRLVGPSAQVFYSVVLLFHLLNVALLFSVARRLTGSPQLAGLVALLWGTCLYHEGTLAWFCVHGHVLVGSALLLALDGLLSAARRGRRVAGQAVWWAILLLVSSTGFGTGLAIALVFPAVALLCARGTLTRVASVVLIALPIVTVALYVLLHVVYSVTPGPRPELALGLLNRGASMAVSLLAHLMAFGIAALVAGFWLYPLPFPSLLAAAIAAGVAVVIVVAWIRSAPVERRWLLALSITAAAPYASIAAARANVPGASTAGFHVWAMQGRYHYVSSIVLALALGLAVRTWTARIEWKRWSRDRVKDGLLVAAAALLLLSFGRSDWRIDLHSSSRAAVDTVLHEAMAAARAVPEGGTAYVEDKWFMAQYIWTRIITYSAIFSLFDDGSDVEGRRLYYVQKDRQGLRLVPPDSRQSRLVVPAPPPTP